MKNASLTTIAEKMKNLDFCMMVTDDGKNGSQSRPMSNNSEVEYDGTSWFFSYDDTAKVKQITNDPKVSLIYQGENMLFIDCQGSASIIREKDMIEEKWIKSLERWFPEGPETPGICLIKVEAEHVQFWHKEEEGTYTK